MGLKLLSVKRSNRAGKKLVAEFSDGTKTHFGASGYGDFTRYWKKDPALAREKRKQYIARHSAQESWRNPRTAATLSRYVLWEKPTVEASVRYFKKKFKL